MSSNSPNADDSHKHSDMNFICGCAMEIEDDANKSCTNAFINEDELFAKHCEHKPMADVDWIVEYN